MFKFSVLKLVNLLFLLILISLLIKWKDLYKVKSDVNSLRFGIGVFVIVMIIMLIYGTTGFMLMDKSDFHQELSIYSSIHYTVDQFNLTTQPLHPYTQRARLFLDSLSLISFSAVVFGLFAIFQPIRFKYEDQLNNRKFFADLLKNNNSESEDFFKLWPNDKKYYFTEDFSAGLSYKVSKGSAIILGDPVGNQKKFKKLLTDFQDDCFINNWNVALVHTTDKYLDLYESINFKIQLIGQEAVVDIDKFINETSKNKYFRNISNKFIKQSYSCEILKPPHNDSIIKRLKEVSDQWLSIPGRTERGFVMGYFDIDYMNMCDIYVVRDAALTIQGFINLIPAEFDTTEATYDLLRHSNHQIGNINDFLILNFIHYLKNMNFKILNMGLSPLSGIDEHTTNEFNIINKLLGLVYANGNRFYSFQGLYRFKAKYEPEWRNRFVVYKGSNFTGFINTMNALVKAMKK